jgi:hypothetical protein
MFRKHSLRLDGRTVVKSAHPRYLRVEIEKTRRAARIAKETGLFRVPDVLDYDDRKGTAVFERIPGLRTIREAARSNRERGEAAARIGRALAIIHRDLRLPDDMTLPIPGAFMDGGGDVFLHGDFGLRNIAFEPGSDVPVILDWQFTDMHGGEATFGSRYFDLVWFVNTLIWIPTAGHLIRDPIAPVAGPFVESYYRTAGLPYDEEALSGYAARFFEAKRPERGTGSRRFRIFVPRCHALSARFVRRLRTDIGHGLPHVA